MTIRTREPSGRIQRRYRDARLGSLWQRIRQFGVKAGCDPRLATEIGRLTLFGHLTATDFEAANRYAEIVARWEFVMGMPRRTVASPSYLNALAAIDNSEPDQHVIDEVRESYHRMLSRVPRPALGMLESVIVDNLMCPQAHYGDLHKVLERLAIFWGIKKHDGGK